jgi:hypothetical protein
MGKLLDGPYDLDALNWICRHRTAEDDVRREDLTESIGGRFVLACDSIGMAFYAGTSFQRIGARCRSR